MDIKCKQTVSVILSVQPVDEKESDRALFAFFDHILNDQLIETLSNINNNDNEPKYEQRRAISRGSIQREANSL